MIKVKHKTADSFREAVEKNCEYYDCLSANIWFKDLNKRYFGVNQQTLTTLGLKDKAQMNDRNDYENTWADYADAYRHYDAKVMQGDIVEVFDPIILSNHTRATILSRREPVFNQDGNIIAISGTTKIISLKQLVDSTMLITEIDCNLDPCHHQTTKEIIERYTYNTNTLTKCESKILFFTIRGLTSKQIATIIHRSLRTVECHINNIRIKFNAESKADLITKSLYCGFINKIPANINTDEIAALQSLANRQFY